MKFTVFYLQLINSFEGLGMFFSSAALIRKLRKYTATGTTPETSRNVFSINQGTNEDDSQSDPHPEEGLLTSGREDRHNMATGVQREREREYSGARQVSLPSAWRLGFLAKKILGFLDISCHDLGNYSW